jgi:hypothetical protein
MKRFLAIFLIALFAFQVSICQENEEENGLIFEEEIEIVEEEAGSEVEVTVENENENDEEAEAEVEAIVENEEEVAGDVDENGEEWFAIQVDEFLNNEGSVPIYNFGTQFLVADLKGNHQLADFDWIPNELHHVGYYKDTNGYEHYKFKVTLVISNAVAQTFDAEYEVQYSNVNPLEYQIVNYAASFSNQNYQDAEGNSVSAILVIRYQYSDESYTEQYLDSTTLDPLSQETPLADDWTAVDKIDDGYGGSYTDWIGIIVQGALKKALDEGTLDQGNWSVKSTDSPYGLPKYQDTLYYRFKFILHDNDNSLDAYGEVFVYQGSNLNVKKFTSAISSLERS